MKILARISLAALFLIVFNHCATAPKPAEMTAGKDPNLSQSEAEFRAKQVEDVQYDLFFDLVSKQEFSGQANLKFNLKETYQGLRIDFFDGTVKEVKMNGLPIKYTYNNFFIFIEKDLLKTGATEINIAFSHKYSNSGDGLHQYIDPEDNKRYLYSNLEPYDANKVFPQFDQPDIKATYKMTVTTPPTWEVITSVRESEIKKDSTQWVWTFPESARFSTYIWSLHAGEYHYWETSYEKTPIRLYVRQSLKKYVKKDDWFKYTKDGLKFYNEYFDYEYPYSKYDSILAPEFNAGAMENVGAVTFYEGLVSRGVKSKVDLQDLAEVILHEMAHMWFGNLVTMKWWDDLWLNESFATYMSHLALADTQDFKDVAWTGFLSMKRWAYWEDQLVTTHPIEAKVPDTLQAMANFDGITYGKGASSIKQLAYFIGAEKFKAGTQAYFKKHAGGNTKLADFMNAMSKAADKDLSEWQKLWLQTTGVNSVQADFSCQKNKVTQFSIKQSHDPEHAHLRPHALQVALLNQKEQSFFVENVLKVYITGESTPVPEAIGKPCPKIVYPNYEDHGYVNVQLDPISLGNLKHGISQVENAFLRNLLWNSLWNMVVYAKLSFEAYGEIVLTGSLRNEEDPFILRDLIKQLAGPIHRPSVISYYYIKEGPRSRSYKSFVERTEQLLWMRLQKAKPESEQQKIFFAGYVGVAQTPLAQKRLRSILDGKKQFRGLKIDQDKRWEIIQSLSALGYPSASTLIRKEATKDKSSQGVVSKLAAEVALPDWNKKQDWIKKFTEDKSDTSLDILRTAAYSLFPLVQTEMRQKFSEDFYEQLKKVVESREVSVARVFTTLAPNECDSSTPKNMEAFINSHPNLKPVVLKTLKIQNQQYGRCRKAMELARSSKFGG